MKDKRFNTAKILIEAGQITFLEIFNIVPKTVVAKSMGKQAINNLIDDPSNFTLAEINKLAGVIGVEGQKLWMLAGEDALKTYKKQPRQ